MRKAAFRVSYQVQNQARGLKFWIYVVEVLYYLYCSAHLHLSCHMQKAGFLMAQLILYNLDSAFVAQVCLY